jgi:predicted nucleic acid-binding protein
MKYYADTGFLLSLHIPETTSASAAVAMAGVSEPLPVIRLLALEFRNALRLAMFRQAITEAERSSAWASWERDIAGGLLEHADVDDEGVYGDAADLCDQFSAILGVRTLDLLHVAYARALGRTEFLSFDKRQRRLATAAGLNVLPEPLILI